jgi:hypothetical protein
MTPNVSSVPWFASESTPQIRVLITQHLRGFRHYTEGVFDDRAGTFSSPSSFMAARSLPRSQPSPPDGAEDIVEVHLNDAGPQHLQHLIARAIADQYPPSKRTR